MIRIILLLTMFSFLADVTTTNSNKITKTKAILRKNTKLQKFVERLTEECDFALLHSIQKDLKNLWAEAMKDSEEIEATSGKVNDVQKLLKDLAEQYNKCSEKLHIDFESQWEIYLKAFGKEYNGKEKEMRKEIFKKNKENMKKHNEMYKKGRVRYSVNLNHFSDWTKQELEKLNGFRPSNITLDSHSRRRARYIDGLLWRYYYYNPYNVMPASVDWRTKDNYVSPVKQQGSCGSCYAMAPLGALEAYHKRKTGRFVILSTQNILDCTWHLGNSGCDGGFPESVYEYAYGVGVVSDLRYPYTMNASHNCRWRREDVVAINRGYYAVEEDNELALRNAVADHGPVTVIIGANRLAYYVSGVFSTMNCGEASHIVLVVGYGTDPVEGDYWIVKNSWGYWWGENGYVRISRNNGNMCHIATRASFPY